jgi:hypothetical protein
MTEDGSGDDDSGGGDTTRAAPGDGAALMVKACGANAVGANTFTPH